MEYLFFFLAVASIIITWLLFVPFINLLYNIKLKDVRKSRKDIFGKNTPVFNKLKADKIGTPIGGGVLVILVTSVLFVLGVVFFDLSKSVAISLLVGFLGFGLIGLLDDIKKTFKITGGRLLELKVWEKFLIQILVATGIAYLLVTRAGVTFGIDVFEIFSGPFANILTMGIIVFCIVYMANAFNITDGVDGLSGGLLMIALVPVILFSFAVGSMEASFFAAILFGSIVAFLYFNVHPARLFMGDAGALAFGAVLTILMIITNTLFILPVLCAVFIFEGLSSLLQWASKLILKRKLFLIAPFHHHLEAIGWDAPKVTFRLWIAGIICALLSVGMFLMVYGG